MCVRSWSCSYTHLVPPSSLQADFKGGGGVAILQSHGHLPAVSARWACGHHIRTQAPAKPVQVN